MPLFLFKFPGLDRSANNVRRLVDVALHSSLRVDALYLDHDALQSLCHFVFRELFFFFKNTVPCSYHSLSHSCQPFFLFSILLEKRMITAVCPEIGSSFFTFSGGSDSDFPGNLLQTRPAYRRALARPHAVVSTRHLSLSHLCLLSGECSFLTSYNLIWTLISSFP